MSTSASIASQYVADSEFCAECGTILPHPDFQKGFVTCPRCKAEWTADKEIVDKVISTSEIFFHAQHQTKATASKDSDGPAVSHLCSHCGHKEATYSTRQTRSADEGQTVFFKCNKCGKQEIEYS